MSLRLLLALIGVLALLLAGCPTTDDDDVSGDDDSTGDDDTSGDDDDATGDDDDSTGDDDDDDDTTDIIPGDDDDTTDDVSTGDCECSAARPTSSVPAALALLALVGFLIRRRR